MRERIQQLGKAFGVLRERDPKAIRWIIAAVLGVLLFFVAAWLNFGSILWLIAGIPAAILAGFVVFGRRMQAMQFDAIEGQPGAAAAVLQQLRGQWFLTPAVAFNKKQDMVHRVVGRPGVVLVGEGARAGVRTLLQRERKRMDRITGDDVPVIMVTVGDGEDEVALDKLQFHLSRLKAVLGKNDVPKLDRRLKPLDRGAPIPQGYLPNPGKKMR